MKYVIVRGTSLIEEVQEAIVSFFS